MNKVAPELIARGAADWINRALADESKRDQLLRGASPSMNIVVHGLKDGQVARWRYLDKGPDGEQLSRVFVQEVETVIQKEMPVDQDASVLEGWVRESLGRAVAISDSQNPTVLDFGKKYLHLTYRPMTIQVSPPSAIRPYGTSLLIFGTFSLMADDRKWEPDTEVYNGGPGRKSLNDMRRMGLPHGAPYGAR